MNKRTNLIKGKKLFAGFLVFCCVLFTLTGCKIEMPDEVAGEGSSLSESAEISEESSLPSEDSASESVSETVSSGSETASSDGKETASSESAKGDAQAGGKSEGGKTSSGSSSGTSGSSSVAKPAPVEPEDTKPDENKPLICTLSITCKTILDNMDLLKPNKVKLVPKDGVIYAKRTVTFYEGETVFDVLLRETKKNRIHMSFVGYDIYKSQYVEAINNLKEFDCGEGSGWMFKVNGWFPNYGCSRYEVKQGDQIEWIYTCDLGHDIGGELDRYE